MICDQANVHYYFRLKHNVQNDSELALSRLELETLITKHLDDIANFVDVLSRQPLLDFVSDTQIRPQDFITRLPYPGVVQGYHAEDVATDCIAVSKRLAYFREFFVLAEPSDSTLTQLLPGTPLEKIEFDGNVRMYNMLPYVQIFTVQKTEPKILLRVIPLHTLYEPSDFVCRLAQKVEHVDRMLGQSIRHLQTQVRRPYSPSSARWFKGIEDFIDSREAPQLYLTHYIFGIRGKFFPRMIGAIMNTMNFSKGDCALDPFCGCGTMNVEAAIHGISSIGVDMHPLFTMITRLKVRSMYWESQWLKERIEQLLQNIQTILKSNNLHQLGKRTTRNSASDQILPRSLMKSIRKDSLEFVERIKSCIEDMRSSLDETTEKDLQDFCKLPLAYWMRSMLKKQDPAKIFQTYREYLWKMFYSIYYLHKFRREICSLETSNVDVYTWDVRKLRQLDDSRLRGEIDGIITSPPYGTAIDYVHDHVWALYLLGLAEDHLKLDEEFHIGSRRSKESLLNEILEKSEGFQSLPEVAQGPLLEMAKRGREQKASAFYKYFVDMRDAFEEMSEALKSGKQLVMIIGKEQSVTLEDGVIAIQLGTAMEELGKKEPANLEHITSVDVTLQKASERGAIPMEDIIFFKKK